MATEFACTDCAAVVSGKFELPLMAALSPEDEVFLKAFLSARGSIKEVERRLGISYPTVKGRLESLLNKLGLGAMQAELRRRRLAVLERLERGEIDSREAAALLRGLEGAV